MGSEEWNDLPKSTSHVRGRTGNENRAQFSMSRAFLALYSRNIPHRAGVADWFTCYHWHLPLSSCRLGGGVKRKKGNTHMHLPAPPSRVGPSGTKAPPSLLQADMLREDLLLLLQLFPLLRYLFKLNFESSKRNANIMKHNF